MDCPKKSELDWEEVLTDKIDLDERLQEAVQGYWDARAKNKEKQVNFGRIDA